jgi:hypothetical protein
MEEARKALMRKFFIVESIKGLKLYTESGTRARV